MSIRARNALLLDLDGTLVDPGAGIIGCYRQTLATLGLEIPEGEDLRWVIGPPIRQSFRQLLGGRANVEEAVRLYRERYSDWGIFEAAAYPGVLEALRQRREAGARLWVCTAKARGFAERVVDNFGFAPLLSGVYGSELDGRFEDKAELIAHILSTERLRSDEVCMVGDRKHDVIAASANGAPSIGVLWGYGGRDELQAAGAALLVEQAHELLPQP